MKNSIRSIKEGSIAKRILALVMDAVIFFFVFGGLASWVMSPIAEAAFDYSGIQVQATNYEVRSKLYVCVEKDEEGNEKLVDVDNYEGDGSGDWDIIPLYNYDNDDINFYKERLRYYYVHYKTGVGVTYPEGKNEADYRAPNYQDLIKDDNGNDVEPASYYNDAWFDAKYGSETDINNFKKDSVYSAVKDLYNQPYFDDLNSKIKGIQLFIILPPFIISFGVFYILIPILFKNGETLGKKVTHLGFITKDGYDIKRRQIVLRQILLFLYVGIFTFGLGIGFTSVATLMLGTLIYLIATFISRTKRSPMDYFAYTYLIDTKKSVWFHDPEEEDKKEQELDEKMAKYRKYEPDQSHVIQIGTEIVNQDVKKELEKEKLKKSKK